MYLTPGSARVGGVGDCTCSVSTLSGSRESSGSRIDGIPPTRPPWWRRQCRELKKIFFSPPSTCPIDLFGSLANRTCLPATRRPTASDCEWVCDMQKHPSQLNFRYCSRPVYPWFSFPEYLLLPRRLSWRRRPACRPARTRRKAFCHRRSGGWRTSTVSSNVEALRSHSYL